MNKAEADTQFATKTALVTGANSGLGFEAAAQLAEAGYGCVILACRSLEKAESAKQALVERVGGNPFETIAVDVSSIESVAAASDELIARKQSIDSLILNAGLVAGDEMQKSVDEIEITFAASMIGHHIMTMRLVDAGLLPEGARVVLVGSSVANNDTPAFMGMTVYDFGTDASSEFGDNLHEAMLAFAKGTKPELYTSGRYYATTKLFSAWWSAAMVRRFGERISVFTVGPGPNMGTNVGRHQKGFMKFMMSTLMPLIGSVMGMNQPTSAGAKRYLDVLHNVGQEFVSGKTYMSPPKTPIGPLTEVVYPHVVDEERQEIAWAVLTELTGVSEVEK
ncbi:MAG: SDR family NAD(P)-dependent oxidoreductase [Chloroflexota bacterium]